MMIANLARRLNFDFVMRIALVLGGLAIVGSIAFGLNRAHLGVAIVGGVLLSYATRKRRPPLNNTLGPPRPGVTRSRQIAACCALVATYSLALLLIRTETPWFYLVVASAFGIVSLQIMSVSFRASAWVVLLEIVATNGLVALRAAQFTSALVGVDPWFHTAVIQHTIQAGHIAESGRLYVSFPGFHLLGAQLSILFNLDAVSAQRVLWVSFSSATVFIFLAGRRLAGTQTGLIAALLLSFADYFLYWQIWMVPYALGFYFFVVILFTVFRGSPRIPLTAVILVLILAVIVIHPLVSLITIGTLFLFALSGLVARRISSRTMSHGAIAAGGLAALAAVMTLGWWMYAASTPPFSPIRVITTVIYQGVRSIDLGALGDITQASRLPYFVVAINEIGLSMALMLAIAGYATISEVGLQDTLSRFRLLLTGGVLIALPFLAAVAGLAFVLPARWLVFGYPFLVLLASIHMGWVARNGFGTKPRRLVYGVAITTILSFCMISSSLGSSFFPLVPESPVRQWFSDAEIKGPSFIISHPEMKIVFVDGRYGRDVFDLWYGCCTNFTPITPAFTYPAGNSYIIVRTALRTEPVVVTNSGFLLGYENLPDAFWARLREPGTSLVYDNGAMLVFLHQG